MELDESDRKILYHISNGIDSYQELADEVDLSRNTVYRRIKSLQEEGYLKEKLLGIPDLEKMGFTFIIVGMNVEIDSMDRAVSLMKEMGRIKTVWETYGQHNIVIVMLCEKENVGQCINEIKKYLTEKNIEINHFDVSTAVESHKLDLSPPFSEVYDFSE